MDRVLQDLRQAVRFLIRQPGWTVAVTLTLALGIGATTSIFSVVDAVLLRPLAFPDPDRLVVVWETEAASGRQQRVAPPTFRDWRRESSAFAGLAAFTNAAYVLPGEETRRVPAMQVSPGFFAVLGVTPSLGRGFSADEEVPGSDRVVVVSHGFWQRYLGSSAAAIGTALELDDETYTVVGVLPSGFRFSERADLWTPLAFAPEQLTEDMRGARFVRVLGRVRDGLEVGAAQRQMSVLAARLAAAHPALAGWDVKLVPWHEQIVGGSRLALLLLLGAVAFLLLVAGVNVTHLLLARAAARERELAIRGALGAGRGRLAAQLVAESVVLALPGGGLALLLAAWCLDAVHLIPWPIPRLDEVTFHERVVVFAACLTLATGFLAGLAPAWSATRSRLAGGLGAAGGGLGGAPRRLRGALVATETALAMVLLVGAGLLLRSFVLLRAVDPGFRPAGVVTAFVSLPEARYAGEPQRRAFVDELLAHLDAMPEVGAAAVATNLPISGSNMTFGFALPGRPQGAGDPRREAEYHAVSPGYFRTLGIPLLAGRAFSGRDGAAALPVAVVNEAMAELYWPGESPLGRRLATYYDKVEREVVGVVGGVRHFGLDREPRPEVYVPYAQNPWPFMALVARTGGDPQGLAAALRGAVSAVDAKLPADAVAPLDELIASSIAPRGFEALLVGVFAATALALALVGLYGVIAWSFARRTREVAVRMALGARRGDVTWQFVSLGLRLVLAGLAAGTAAALGLTRFLQGFLYGIGPRDPATFAAIAVLLGVVALAACLRPAWRAARLDPAAALRGE